MLRLHPNHQSHLRPLAPYGYLTGFGCYRLSWCDGRCVQDPGTYSPRHADSRLLATPTSCRRVSAYNPNWDWLSSFAPPRGFAARCTSHCSTCVALDIRGMMI
ncbi:putative lipoprotein [Clostridium botulinum C str. Eklund]|nr:putative lipoprotein [Clostridium botulinum C str. Eklund]EDS77683.1 putative lipoprotein [Clostridium botulinum C str. Eklund]